MRKAILVAVALLVAVSVTMAWAQGPGTGGRTGRTGQGGSVQYADRMGLGLQMTNPAMAVTIPSPQMWERMAEPLSLSEDQKTKLVGMATKAQELLQPMEKKLSDATQALRTAVLAPDSTAETLSPLVTAAQKAESDLISARISAWMQMKAVLNAEQLKKLAETMTVGRGPASFGGRTDGGDPGTPRAPGVRGQRQGVTLR